LGRRRKKPVIIENVEITNIAAKAKGLAKVDGKVYFVDDAIPGDVANIYVYKNKKDYAFAKIKRLIKGSQNRIKPFCTHFRDCGGCKWQYLNYENQLKYKAQIVDESFERIAKENELNALSIVACEKTTFYRNKMEYSFSHDRWKTKQEIEDFEFLEPEPALGFHVPGFFDKIVDIDKCWLQNDFANSIRNLVRDFAKENSIEFWHIKKQEGFLRNLIIRNTRLKDWMVVLIVAENDQNTIVKILEHIHEKHPKIKSLQYVINSKANDTIYDLPVHLYKGQDYIYESIGDLKFKITAKSFFQTNSFQAKVLYDITKDFAQLSGEEVVYDLYSGTGTIGLYFAQQAKKIVGIETVEDAVEAAKENAALNNIENAKFYCGEVRKIIDDVIEKEGKADLVVIDPPRMGLHGKVIEQLIELNAPKIVYVSCNPATQARDVLLLKDKYKLIKYQPVDMFPHTYHIENVALLERI